MNNINNLLTFEMFQFNYRKVSEPYYNNAQIAFSILSYPAVIYSMIDAIHMGFSPLNAICKMLEAHVDCSNTQVRQIIGLEIRYILSIFGYKPIKNSRETLRKVCRGKYFVSGSLYELVESSKYTFHVTIEEA